MVNETETVDGHTVYAIVKNDEYVNLKPGDIYQVQVMMKNHIVLKNNKRRYTLTAFDLVADDGTIIRKDTKQLGKGRIENWDFQRQNEK